MKKNKLKFLVFLVLSFLIITNHALASTTDGTIISPDRYGWGENIGWVDFGSEAGNVHITDTALSGSAYGENIGWINLSTVTNNSEGNLGGYAWGENIGWVDFSGVIIDSQGYFTGQAYGENIGFITFAKDAGNMMLTDWRPKSSENTTVHHTSSGSCPVGAPCSVNNLVVVPPTIPPVVEAPTTTPEQILGSGKCLSTLIITDNLKQGDKNGKYSTYNKGIVKQVDILQAHINRILAASYKQASGPVDGIFGPLTKQGVMRLQESLNTILKPTPLLKIDGIVGPFTKEAINNSCGK